MIWIIFAKPTLCQYLDKKLYAKLYITTSILEKKVADQIVLQSG